MAKKFDLTIEIVPVSGAKEQKKVSVTASATMADVAKAAGLTAIEKKNLFLDGKPADADSRVTSDSKVKFTERPQGS